jgi:hypothetical protein
MDFKLPEELKMVQTLARDFVKDQLYLWNRGTWQRSLTWWALNGSSGGKEDELVRTASRTMGLEIPGPGWLGLVFSLLAWWKRKWRKRLFLLVLGIYRRSCLIVMPNRKSTSFL